MGAPLRAPRLLTQDDLAYLSAPALRELYNQADPPAPGELCGRWRGLFLSSSYEPSWLRSMRVGLNRSLLMSWRGLELDPPDEDGIARGTHLFGWSAPRPLLRFEAHHTPNALVLEYDLPENLAPLRALRDEVRQLRSGLYLCRWLVKLPGGPRCFGFFSLAPEEE